MNFEPGALNSDTYVPRTLRHTANQQAGLPVAECLKLGLALTDALGFLHEHGLVHRDIKPSNIIFVNGVAKLADIGLVTGVEETRSFVGTEGFIAPEGPGTPQADLYSLGKVLYEISTGKDRQAFPDLPTNIGQSSDRAELLELNEILVKACANDPQNRYTTAMEMRADLALLESGRSIRRLRVAERRFAQARFVGLVAAGVAVVATVAVLFFARQAKREHEFRERLQEEMKLTNTARQSARQESYARAMLLAHEGVHANNFGLVRELLDQTRAFAMTAGTSNAAQRTLPWEWRRLQYECRDEAASVLAQCADSLASVAVSPGGGWLAAGLDNGQVLLQDLLGNQSRQEWPVAKSGVECLAFSPNSELLAAGCADGSVRVLAVPSGKLTTEFQEPDGIIDLCFSQDGRQLAYGSTLRISIGDVLTGHHTSEITASTMYRLAITPNLGLITATLYPQGLAWWSKGTNAIFPDVVGNRFTDHGQAISPNGRWLAIALADYSIELWSVAEKRPVHRLPGHSAAIRAVAWSPDSRLLASGSYDQTVIVWDAERGAALRRLRGHQDFIVALAFSPNGRTLYSASQDRTVRAWANLQSVSDGDKTNFTAHVAYGLISPGARFAWGVVSNDTFWALNTQPVPSLHSRLQGSFVQAAISPDGRWMAAADNDCKMYRYENDKFTLDATHRTNLHTESAPGFSPDGSRVAMVGTNGVLVVWQLKPWRELARWVLLERAWSKATRFDPTGKRVFIFCPFFGVIVAEMDTRRLISMPKDGKYTLSGMDISPDNRLLAVSSFRGTVALWACAPGEEPHRLDPDIPGRTDAWSVAFSPDSQRLAVGLANGNIQIWDIRHRMLVGVLKGHRHPVLDLGFNPDDDSLVSISPDELRVWRVADRK